VENQVSLRRLPRSNLGSLPSHKFVSDIESVSIGCVSWGSLSHHACLLP